MSLLIELPQYQRAQKVGALRIAHIIPNPRGVELHFDNTRYAPIQVSLQWVTIHIPEVGAYFVVMEDGRDGCMSAERFDAEFTAVVPT
jgi:hypothetical protein